MAEKGRRFLQKYSFGPLKTQGGGDSSKTSITMDSFFQQTFPSCLGKAVSMLQKGMFVPTLKTIKGSEVKLSRHTFNLP